jgi:hypothetical protein
MAMAIPQLRTFITGWPSMNRYQAMDATAQTTQSQNIKITEKIKDTYH